MNKKLPRLTFVIIIFLVAALIASPIMPDFSIFGRNVGKDLRDLKIKLGLDLKGGVHLVYKADMSQIPEDNIQESLAGARDVIERRVNAYGIAEPQITTSQSGDEYRIIVDLAGAEDVTSAIQMIGATPILDFREEDPEVAQKIETTENPEELTALLSQVFKPTPLSGKNLERAQVVFDNNTQEPQVSLQFDDQGKELFKEITERNVGRRIAIFLDGNLVTAPVVNTPITNGQAVITGSFTPQEAREMAKELNAGALPVPVEIISQEKVGATLGHESLTQSLRAGILGLILVSAFMLIFYLVFGGVAITALIFYAVIMVAVFKILGITLTLSGIAGFILSIGMAVDANILIFERTKEELKEGRDFSTAVRNGFQRAWTSIRDGNISTLITCFILASFGTGLVKGFAITLGIGVTLSMFTAIFVSRTLIEVLAPVLKKHPLISLFSIKKKEAPNPNK